MDYLKVRIPSFSYEIFSGSSKVVYEIKVSLRGVIYATHKRYSDFFELHKLLKSEYDNLPSFPARTFFALKNKSDLDKRRAALQNYLELVCQREEIVGNQNFFTFIELTNYVPDILADKIVLKAKVLRMARSFDRF